MVSKPESDYLLKKKDVILKLKLKELEFRNKTKSDAWLFKSYKVISKTII